MVTRPRPRGTIRLTHLDSGKNFRQWLKDKIEGLNRERLAKRIGVNRTQFNNWAPVNDFSESNFPSYRNFLKVIEYFGENPHSFHRQGTSMFGEIEARRDEILKCYHILGMSAEEIAPYFETSSRTIGRILLEDEKLTQAQKNDRKVLFEIGDNPEEKIRELVKEEKLSKTRIVNQTGIPASTLNRLLDEYQIESPTIWDEAQNICQGYPDISMRDLASEYGVCPNTIRRILVANERPIRDPQSKGEVWEQRRLNAVRKAREGKPISDEHKIKMQEGRRKSPKGKVLYRGILYDSKSEAAVAQIFENYIPGYFIKPGETFQRISSDGKSFDFVFPGNVVEWHPPRIDYDKGILDEGDYEAYLELKRECPNERRVLDKMVLRDLAKTYEQKRREVVENDFSVKNYSLTVLKNFNDLYSFISKYNEDIPHKSELRKEFDQVRRSFGKKTLIEKAEAA